MTIMVDGDFNQNDAQRNLINFIDAMADETEDVKECLRDKVLYHAPEGVPYANTIGMPVECPETGEVTTYCIGCYYCEYGARTHEGNERVKELVDELCLNLPSTYGVKS